MTLIVFAEAPWYYVVRDAEGKEPFYKLVELQGMKKEAEFELRPGEPVRLTVTPPGNEMNGSKDGRGLGRQCGEMQLQADCDRLALYAIRCNPLLEVRGSEALRSTEAGLLGRRSRSQ